MVLKSWRPSGRDLAFAAALAMLVPASAATAPPGRMPLDVRALLLLVVAAAATAFRWRAPVLVVGIAAASQVAYSVRGYPGLAGVLPVLFALYAAVKARHRRAAGAAIAVTVIGSVAGELAYQQSSSDVLQRWTLLVGWVVAAVVAGELSRKHSAYLDQVEQRAAEAERTREETARRRADEERLRIARELHDALTHSISIIKVQAGVAVHLARKRDQPVDEALVAIQTAAGEAMRELRATLEVLRDEGDSGESELVRMEQLIDGARRAGVHVRVQISGTPRALPGPVDRAAYRIIQEALTNVTRHAGPKATAVVELGYCDDELVVRVDDDGSGDGVTPAQPGVGLVGMRERVAALGGSLHAGPRGGGGFTVHAELPVEAGR